MVSTPRWGGLRIEPYDPRPRDGDLDFIVQEDTCWERPAGTTLLDELGRPIVAGATSAYHIRGISYIDRNGKTVEYKPRTLDDIQAGTPALQRLGYPSLTVMGHESVGQRAANAHLSEVGAVASSEYDALEAAGAFETKLENIPDEVVFVEGARGPLPYDLTDLGFADGKSSLQIKTPEQRHSAFRNVQESLRALWGRGGSGAEFDLDEPATTHLPQNMPISIVARLRGQEGNVVPISEWLRTRGNRKKLEVDDAGRVIYRGKDGTQITRRQVLQRMLKNSGVESLDDLTSSINKEAESLMVREAQSMTSGDILITLQRQSLSGVIKKGMYGTQHSVSEEEKIGGGQVGGARDEFEQDVFGVDVSDVNPLHRPVYGHADVRGLGVDLDEQFASSAYGGSDMEGQRWHLVLGDEANDRATYTFGDTLADHVRPVPASLMDGSDEGIANLEAAGFGVISEFHQKRLAAEAFERAIKELSGNDEDLSDVMIGSLGLSTNAHLGTVGSGRMPASPWESAHPRSGQYFEAQVHGGVNLSDLKAVIVPDGASKDGDQGLTAEELSKLKESGVTAATSSTYGTVQSNAVEGIVSPGDLEEHADWKQVIDSKPYESAETLERKMQVLQAAVVSRRESGQRTRLLELNLDKIAAEQEDEYSGLITNSDAFRSATAEEKVVMLENAMQYQKRIGGNTNFLHRALESVDEPSKPTGNASSEIQKDTEDPRVMEWVNEIRAGEAGLDDISDPVMVAAVEQILNGDNNSAISSETDMPVEDIPSESAGKIKRLLDLRHGSNPDGSNPPNAPEQVRMAEALADDFFLVDGVSKDGSPWHTRMNSTNLSDWTLSSFDGSEEVYYNLSVEGAVIDSETGNVIGVFTRTINLSDPDNPVAQNDSFSMNANQQGTGIGRKFISETLSRFHAAGINKVTLQASSTRPGGDGGLAADSANTGFTTWAKLGAELDGTYGIEGLDVGELERIVGKPSDEITADDIRSHAEEIVGLDLIADMTFDLTSGLPEGLISRPANVMAPISEAEDEAKYQASLQAERDAAEALMREAIERGDIEQAKREAELERRALEEATERQRPEVVAFPTKSEDLTIPTPYDLTEAMVIWSSEDPSGPRDLMPDVYAGPETLDAAYDRIRKENPDVDLSEMDLAFGYDKDLAFKRAWTQYLRHRASAAALLTAISEAEVIDQELTRGEISEIPGYADTFVPGQPFTMDARGFTTEPSNSRKFSTIDESKGGDSANKTAVVFVVKPGDSTALPIRYFDTNRMFRYEKEHLLAGTYEVVTVEQQTRMDFNGEPQTVTVITIVQTAAIPKPPTDADGIVGWR